MKRRLFKLFLSVTLLAAMIVSPLNLTTAAYVPSNGGPDASPNLRTSQSQGSGSVTATASSGAFTPSAKVPYASVKAAIQKYQAANNDVHGWLIVPNTNINMPIAHIPASQFDTQNQYYTYRDINKKDYQGMNYKNFKDTVTFTDYRTKIGTSWKDTSRNTVLYGHNWTNLRGNLAIGKDNNHIMFGQLPSYTNLKFAEQNPYIYYSTDKAEGVWKVFAVGYSEVDSSFFYNNPNPTDEQFNHIVSEWKQRSIYNFNVPVSSSDRILTLTTCTRVYGDRADQRYVVVARLLRPGESDKDPVNIALNQNVKQPQFKKK